MSDLSDNDSNQEEEMEEKGARHGEMPSTSTNDHPVSKKAVANQHKAPTTGVVYLQTVPDGLSASRLREIMTPYGKIGRVYLAPEKTTGADGKKRKRFSEGWIEFGNKKIAKRVAASFNNTLIGGKRRSRLAECLWSLKYLHRFKWSHLTEQLKYERAVHQQRIRAEVTHAKRQANFFAAQIEKGKELKDLEEKILRKGGKWERYQRQIHQKQPKTQKKLNNKETDAILAEIFAE